MSLIKCDECGREISTKSLFCPGCGYPTHLNKAMAGTPEPDGLAALREALETVEPEPAAEPQQEVKPEKEQQPADEIVASAPAEAEETAAPSDSEPDPAVAAYEAGLEGGTAHRRRNEAIKVWLFVGVFLALLGVVLYFYFTSPVDGETDAAVADEEIEAVVDDATTASDTVSISDSLPAAAQPAASQSAVAKPVAAPAAKPAQRPAATEPQDDAEPLEIGVKSLSEQAGLTEKTE